MCLDLACVYRLNKVFLLALNCAVRRKSPSRVLTHHNGGIDKQNQARQERVFCALCRKENKVKWSVRRNGSGAESLEVPALKSKHATERQPAEWERICSQWRLISGIYKELKKLSNNKTKTQWRNEHRIWTGIFQRIKYKWPTDKWKKNAQDH